jgi:hypothetical protein
VKLLLITPGWPTGSLWGELGFKFPSLSFAALAAVTPPHWEVELCDENVERINFAANADLVAITAMTPQVPRAYERADTFRERKIPVVMGGFHVSNLPDEGIRHADAIVVGEGNRLAKASGGFRRGSLQRMYRSVGPVDGGIPAARRDIFNGRNTSSPTPCRPPAAVPMNASSVR